MIGDDPGLPKMLSTPRARELLSIFKGNRKFLDSLTKKTLEAFGEQIEIGFDDASSTEQNRVALLVQNMILSIIETERRNARRKEYTDEDLFNLADLLILEMKKPGKSTGLVN